MSNYKYSNIHCLQCNKKYRGKKKRNRNVYVCSGYENYGKKICKIRNILWEDELTFVINRHFKRDVRNEEIKELVQSVKVYEDRVEIIYNDGETSEFSNQHINF